MIQESKSNNTIRNHISNELMISNYYLLIFTKILIFDLI